MATKEEYPDRIGALFTGKNILLTGGTGFMGKVFLEKMLRQCPDIEQFYLLVRTKKGKDPQERLKDVFANPLFDKIKGMYGPEFLTKKCQAVAGDVSEINLGMDPADRKLLQEKVNYIYHCAATVRFDEPLKHAVLLNTRGTKLMLELALECKHIELFCHVSTAYAFLKEKLLEERAYPPPADPHETIKTVEWMASDIVESITDKILAGLPNTYAFTKSLGECLVVEQMQKLPVIILRPSVVIPVWKEPLPGWTDNINGPTGLLIGAGKGVIRTMFCDKSSYADFLPVDIAANAMAVATYDFLTYKTRQIYNLTSSHELRVTWNEIIDLGRKVIEKKMPLNGVVWYPGGSMKSSRLVHNICFFLFHTIPAVLVDTLLFCLGYKPVLCRVQRRIAKGFEIFEYYANNQWDFENKNHAFIKTILNPREKVIYKIDREGLDLEQYFTDCTHAARLYILNESDETLPAARRHMKVMWCVDKITKLLFVCLVLYLLYIYIYVPIFGA